MNSFIQWYEMEDNSDINNKSKKWFYVNNKMER